MNNNKQTKNYFFASKIKTPDMFSLAESQFIDIRIKVLVMTKFAHFALWKCRKKLQIIGWHKK